MATPANEPNTLEDLLSDNGIAEPMRLKLSLLETITKNFSDEQIVGSGAYGTVYRGVLGDGFVAVKKLFSSHAIEDEPFEREVDCMMRIRHHNIVWFVGYCAEVHVEVVRQGTKNIFAETREKLLCFEYLRNGSHHSHVADFGLSRLLDDGKSRTITKEKIGTRGYIAPEYLDNGVITVKADIYSLGVIIRHMVKGRSPEATIDDGLKIWAIRLEQESLETKQTPLELDYRQIEACLEISESCTEFNPDKRPTVSDILHRLKKTEAEDHCVITNTAALGRISSLSKLMEVLRLMASQQPSTGHEGPTNTGTTYIVLRTKISWLDTRSNAKCYMVSSRSLHIEHVDSPGYWKWTSRPDSRFAECAELLKVYFLAILGEILTVDLSLGTTYAVYLVYKLASDTAGLNGAQTSSVRLYGERTVATSRVSVDPAARLATADVVRPVARQDGWMELKLAEFAPDDKLLLNETAVIVDFREENTRVQKRGLIVEGMEFRPCD